MRLSDFIQTNSKRIAKEWETFARSRGVTTAGMSRLVLRDHIDEILAAVADNMREPQSLEDQAEKGKGRGEKGPLGEVAQEHAKQRVDAGFRADQAASEFRALRASVVRL